MRLGAQRFPELAVRFGHLRLTAAGALGGLGRVLTQMQRHFTAQVGAAGLGQLEGAVAVRVHGEQAARHQLPVNGAPLVGGELAADVPGGNMVVAGGGHFVAAVAGEHVHQMVDAETLAGAEHAAECLL